MLGGPQDRSRQMQKISPPSGIRSPHLPARSQSPHRLSYPGPHGGMWTVSERRSESAIYSTLKQRVRTLHNSHCLHKPVIRVEQVGTRSSEHRICCAWLIVERHCLFNYEVAQIMYHLTLVWAVSDRLERVAEIHSDSRLVWGTVDPRVTTDLKYEQLGLRPKF
jgi:hypothetical protein